MNKVACYVRVSTENQLENYSIDEQTERLKAYCKAKDIAIYENFIGNTSSSNCFVYPINSSLLSYGKETNKSKILNEDIANEIFGEMRYLTPEENENKMNMYRNKSTVVKGAGFFD